MLAALRLALRYRLRMGRWPRLARPVLFSEKVQAAKLGWRSPLMPLLADKHRVKAFIAHEFGPAWVTPSFFAGPALPPRAERDWPLPYVVKATHRSRSNLFVRSEAERDWDAIERRVGRWLARPYGRALGEWAYRGIAPRVLVEPFLGEAEPPMDFKLLCFGGVVKYIEIHTGRFTAHRSAYYTPDWILQPFAVQHPIDTTPRPRPGSLDRMIALAESIGSHFPFVRVDFYEIGGEPRFGEVSFYPDSGFKSLVPEAYEEVLGALWPPGLPADTW